MAGDESVVGKVSVRVYPDTDFFAKRLAVFLKRVEKHERVDIEVHPDDDRFVQKVRRTVRRAERSAGDIDVDLDVNDDKLKRSLDGLRRRLAEGGDLHYRVSADRASLRRIERQLQGLRENARIDVTVHESGLRDAMDGFRERLSREIARTRGAYRVPVDIDTEQGLRQAMRRIRSVLGNQDHTVDVDVRADVDDRGVRRALDDMQQRMRDLDDHNVRIDIDRDSAHRARERIRRILSEPQEIHAELNTGRVRLAMERLAQRGRQLFFGLDVDEMSERRTREKLDDIVDDYDGKDVELKVEADAWLARRELQYTARTRFVTLVVNVSKASVARAEATLRALSGLRFLERGLRRIWDNFKNIDKNIVIIGSIAEAVAGLTAWLLAASSNTFSLARGLAQISGLGLLLPGVLGGFVAGIGGTVAVMKDMLIYVPELRNMFSALQDSMSTDFWVRFEAPFRRMIDVIFPEFRAGMRITSMALGTYFANISDEVRRQLSGSMLTMFGNLTESILISAQGAETFVSIIETLGRRGSAVLPRLARWWNDVAGNFDSWLTATERSGRLDEIIETAIQNARDLGWVVYHTGGMLAGLARAAEEAGGSTLESLAAKMERIHRAVDRPLFQAGLIRALEAAHDAMDRISTRSGPRVTEFFQNLSHIMERGFPEVGDAIGSLIGGLAEALSTERFSHGLLGFLQGLREGVESLSRAWGPLGDGLGAFGDFVGTIARQFGPLLAEMLIQVSGAMQTLGPYLERWVISLSDRLLPMFAALAPVAIGLAEAVARLIDPLMRTTGAVELMIAALGGFFLFKNFLGPIDNLVTKMLGMQVTMGTLGAAARVAATKISAWWTALGAVGKAGVIGAIALALGALVGALTDLGKIDADKVTALNFDQMSFSMDRAAERMKINGAQILDSWARVDEQFDRRVAQTALEDLFDGITSRGGSALDNLSGLENAARNLGVEFGFLEESAAASSKSVTNATDQGFGRPTRDQVDRSAEAFQNLGQKIKSLVDEGKVEEAGYWFAAAEDAARNFGMGADFLQQAMPGVGQAVQEATAELEQSKLAFDLGAQGMRHMHEEIRGFGSATPAMVAAIQDAALAFFDIAGAISETDSKMEELGKTASAMDYAKSLEEQVTAQRDWADDMATLAKHGVDEVVLNELARLGPEGALMVALMADELDGGTREATDRIETAIKEGMKGPIAATEGEFAAMAAAAADGIAALPQSVQDQLADMDPEDLLGMTEMGLMIMIALANGVEAGGPEAQAAIEREALNMQRRFAGAMEIHSPSRVFIRFGGDIIAGLLIGLTQAAPGITTILSSIATGIITPFMTAGTWLIQAGSDLIGGLIQGITSRGPDTSASGVGIKDRVADAFSNPLALLPIPGSQIISGLIQGILGRGGDVTATGQGTKKRVSDSFSDSPTLLNPRGNDLISGLIRGINTKGPDTTTAGRNTRDRVRDVFNNAGTLLNPRGASLIQGLIRGINATRGAARVATVAVRSAVTAAFSNASSLLLGRGGQVGSGLIRGISGTLGGLRSVMSAVRGAASNVSVSLYGRGASIIRSLANGISSGIGRIRSMLQGLTASIPSWKGPASTDARLLFNAGQLIIGGLVAGLESQYTGVYASLQGLSKGIEGVRIGGPTVEGLGVSEGALRGAQGAIRAPGEGAAPASDQIIFNGPVGMTPEDVAAEIAWRKRQSSMRMGLTTMARGV